MSVKIAYTESAKRPNAKRTITRKVTVRETTNAQGKPVRIVSSTKRVTNNVGRS